MKGAERIITRRTDELVPYANNARTHNAKQVKQIAASITEFGFTNPVLIDEEGGIIAGHGRVLAAQSLGLEEVPCIELKDLTQAQKKAYILADNKLALNAGWDEEMLKIEIDELKAEDFDIDLTGFNDKDFEEKKGKTPEEAEEVYNTNTVFQITVFYQQKEYERVLAVLNQICGDHDYKNNSAAVLHLINGYAKSN